VKGIGALVPDICKFALEIARNSAYVFKVREAALTVIEWALN
jgi:hypothetical protein